MDQKGPLRDRSSKPTRILMKVIVPFKLEPSVVEKDMGGHRRVDLLMIACHFVANNNDNNNNSFIVVCLCTNASCML